MFRASRFCIRASQTGEALARWAGGSKPLMLSPARMNIASNSLHFAHGVDLKGILAIYAKDSSFYSIQFYEFYKLRSVLCLSDQ